MKPADIIQALQQLDPDKEIIVAWWEADTFEDIPESKWDEFVELIEYKGDWSRAHDMMSSIGEHHIKDLYEDD